MKKKFKSGDVIVTRRDCYIHKDADVVERHFCHNRTDAVKKIISKRSIPHCLSGTCWRSDGGGVLIPKGTPAVVRDYDDVFLSSYDTLRCEKSKCPTKGEFIDAGPAYDKKHRIYFVNVPGKKVVIFIDGYMAWVESSSLIERAEDNAARFKSTVLEIKLKYEFKTQSVKDVMKSIEKKLQSMNSVSYASSCTLSGLEINVDDNKSIIIDVSRDIEEQLKQCVKTSE